MVILKTYNSAGETGRCDARCYEAKTKRCRCCCGGRNHGAGLNQAIKNSEEICKQAAAGNCPQKIEQVTFETPVRQLYLFPA